MSAKDIGRFSADLTRFQSALGDRLDALTQHVAFDLAERVVDRTPVDTGNARAHWWADVNGSGGAPLGPTTLAGGTAQAPSPAPDLGPALLGARAGDVVHLNNNAAYIAELEHGRSQKAPNGMVAITLAEGPQLVERAAREMASGDSGRGRAA
jgi:hypothetical protein